MENTAYFQAICATRAMRLDEQEALEGQTLLSTETCEELIGEDNLLMYIRDNFGTFLKAIRILKKEDQMMILSYYINLKPQQTIAPLFKSTQTLCSFRLRMAVKTVGAYIMMGGIPTEEQMAKVFKKAKVEDSLEGAKLSQLVALYAKHRNFQTLANKFDLHRPDIRRTMSRVSLSLIKSPVPAESALAAYIYSLIDKAHPEATGVSNRKRAKEGHILRQDPDVLGKFRINLAEPGFDKMFMSQANI